MRLGWVAILSLLVVAGLIAALAMPPGGRRGSGSTRTLFLYCAAGMQDPITRIVEQYEAETGGRVEIEFSGSGALLSKIKAADQGDLFLAADIQYLEQGRQLGLVEEMAAIAHQRPVLAVRPGDPRTESLQTLDDLLAADVRITLADPAVAAISKATRQALEGTGKWEQLWAKKAASVDTVNLVANHVLLDTADVGIVWNTTVNLSNGRLRQIALPEFEAGAKQISLGLLTTCKDPPAALHFLRYVTAKDRGLKVFEENTSVVDGDQWDDRPELVVFAGGLNRPAIERTIDEFEAREGVVVNDSYNGCGALVGQMKGGARPDVYFACDVSFMTSVSDLFSRPLDLAGTDMVIIVRPDWQGREVKGMADLGQEGLKVGLCSPTQSALGALSKRLLTHHRLYDKVHPNVLDEPPTADMLVAKVVSGGLDAAIVYRANTTLQKDSLRIIDIADPLAHAIQPIAVADDSKYRHLSQRLVDRIKSAESAQLFQELGFEWLLKETRP